MKKLHQTLYHLILRQSLSHCLSQASFAISVQSSPSKRQVTGKSIKVEEQYYAHMPIRYHTLHAEHLLSPLVVALR